MLGLWTLIGAVPKLAQVFIKLFIFSRQSAMMRIDPAGMTAPEIGATLIQLGIGVWLLFGAAGLVAAVRGVGRDKVENETE